MGVAACRPHHRWLREDGSAAVEVALTLPLVVLALVLLAQTAVLGSDVVAAQGVAREAARVAAVADDATVFAAARRVAGSRLADLTLTPPDGARRAGDDVTASIVLRSRAFASFGARVEIPARATMRTER